MSGAMIPEHAAREVALRLIAQLEGVLTLWREQRVKALQWNNVDATARADEDIARVEKRLVELRKELEALPSPPP